MRLEKILSLFIVVFILVSILFFIDSANANETVENNISATFNIVFNSATELNVKVNMDVEKITLQGVKKTTYAGSEISTIAESDLTTLGKIIQQLNIYLSEQIEKAFPNIDNDDIDSPYDAPYYENGLFRDEYTINLTSDFFELKDSVNASEFVNGLIYMGAIANYSFDFNAKEGWYNTFDVSLANPLIMHSTNGEEISNIMQWTVDNRNGAHPDVLAKFQIKHDTYGELRQGSEDVNLEFVLDTKQIEKTRLEIKINVKNVDIRNYNILPDFITGLDFVPADGIRLFIKNNLLYGWDDFYDKTIEKIRDRVVPIIENSPSFNQTLSTDYQWDENTTVLSYSITDMNNKTPIRSILTDSDISLKICDISPRALFGLLNIGASVNITQDDINFGKGLKDVSYPYIGFLYLPTKVSLDGKNTYQWEKSENIMGDFESEISKEYYDDQIDTFVEIEINDADLNLLGIFTGKTELDLGMYLQETQNYYVSEIPDQFIIPEKVVLKYINSDAFRLCVEENIFDEQNIEAFLKYKSTLFEARSKDVLSNSKVDLTGHHDRNAFDNSVSDWDGDITSMDEDIPVEVASYAHCSYPASCKFSVVPPKFDINAMNFSFSGIQKQSVTYKITFPKGITLEAEDELGRIIVKQENDRYSLQVSFNSSESGLKDVVECKVEPSALFLLGIFMPCILSVVVTVILVAVVYLFKKKRGGKRPKIVKEEKDFDGYEGEDYYVPPPPPSARK